MDKLSEWDHKKRHEQLHEMLDELVADFISHTATLPSQATIMELMAWSHQQTKEPTENK